MPDRKDRLSKLAGAFKRLGTRVPECTDKKLARIISYARKYIYPEFTPLQLDDIQDTDTWINNINHPEKRKQELREAYAILKEKGLFKDLVSEEDEASLCKSFCKDEAYDEEKPHRWINASSDLVKVAYGPIADAVMHEVVKHPMAIKKIPVRDRPAYICERLGPYTIAQSSDASSMEDHYANTPGDNYIGEGGCRLDHMPHSPHTSSRWKLFADFMRYMCGGLPVPANVLAVTRFTFFNTSQGINFKRRYEVWSQIRDSVTLADLFDNIINGYRKLDMKDFGYIVINAILCSGEMDTSLKNLISMYIMTNFAQYDISLGLVVRALGVGEGDDSLVVYSQGIGPDERWWEDYGWLIKIEYIGPVCEAAFCQLVFDPIDLCPVPDIRKVLRRLGWTGGKYVHTSDRVLLSLLRAKALSMACEYNDVPILGPLAQRILFLTKHVHIRNSIVDSMSMYDRERYLQSLRAKPWQLKPNIGPRTRALVERLQGISVSQQLLAEQYLSTISFGYIYLPFLDFSPVATHAFSRASEEKRLPRLRNQHGRQAVVEAMLDIIDRDLEPYYRRGKYWVEKYEGMVDDLLSLL